MWIKIEQADEFGKHLGKKVAVGINEQSLSKEESGTIVQDPEMGVCVLTESGRRIALDVTMLTKVADENRAVYMWAANSEAVFPEAVGTGTGTPGSDETPVGSTGEGEQTTLPTGDAGTAGDTPMEQPALDLGGQAMAHKDAPTDEAQA